MDTTTSPDHNGSLPGQATQATLSGELTRMDSREQLLPMKSDDQEISDFAQELEEAVRDVESAFADARDVGVKVDALQQELNNRNLLGALMANFSSRTDKELATMVQSLGASLGLTQRVVRVILKVQTRKHRLLYAFNDALVEKIARIQGDSHTLYGNQKQAALVFLGELQEQMNEQIRQQNLVDNHEQRIRDHEQWQLKKEGSETELVRRVTRLEATTAALKQHLEVLEPRLALLEAADRQSRSFRATFIRNLLPLVALATAVAAASMVLML